MLLAPGRKGSWCTHTVTWRRISDPSTCTTSQGLMITIGKAAAATTTLLSQTPLLFLRKVCVISHSAKLLIALHTEKSSSISATTVVPASAEEWLKSFKLERYWDTFRDNGYDFMETITELNDATLDLLGIEKAGHRALLLRKARELKK